MKRRVQAEGLGGGFGAEDAAEAGPGKLDADEALTGVSGICDVRYAAASGEVRFLAKHGSLRKGDADFEIAANRQIEARDESGAIAAEIFAGSFFLEQHAMIIAAADFQRQAHRDSTFRALFRAGRTELDHGLGPPLLQTPKPSGSRKTVRRCQELHQECAPHVRCGEARCRFPHRA